LNYFFFDGGVGFFAPILEGCFLISAPPYFGGSYFVFNCFCFNRANDSFNYFYSSATPCPYDGFSASSGL